MTSQTKKALSHKSSVVFYDLETTGFGQAQIVGLGAVDTIGNTFHRAGLWSHFAGSPGEWGCTQAAVGFALAARSSFPTGDGETVKF